MIVEGDRGPVVLEDQVDGDLEAVLEGPGLLEAVLELELEDQVDDLDDEKGRQDLENEKGRQEPGAGGSPRGPARTRGRPRGRFTGSFNGS